MFCHGSSSGSPTSATSSPAIGSSSNVAERMDCSKPCSARYFTPSTTGKAGGSPPASTTEALAITALGRSLPSKHERAVRGAHEGRKDPARLATRECRRRRRGAKDEQPRQGSDARPRSHAFHGEERRDSVVRGERQRHLLGRAGLLRGD